MRRFTQVLNVIMTSKRSKYFTIGGAVLIALLFGSVFIKLPVLSVETKDEFYWSFDKTFTLSWIHSVEKEEWMEFYEVKDNQLLLTHTSFKTFGAGVPSTFADGKDVALDNGFITMETDRIFPSLYMAVSDNVKSTMIIDEKTIPLYKLTNDYEAVNISVIHISLWEMLLKGEHL